VTQRVGRPDGADDQAGTHQKRPAPSHRLAHTPPPLDIRFELFLHRKAAEIVRRA
jgi:hypothetical protein